MPLVNSEVVEAVESVVIGSRLPSGATDSQMKMSMMMTQSPTAEATDKAKAAIATTLVQEGPASSTPQQQQQQPDNNTTTTIAAATSIKPLPQQGLSFAPCRSSDSFSDESIYGEEDSSDEEVVLSYPIRIVDPSKSLRMLKNCVAKTSFVEKADFLSTIQKSEIRPFARAEVCIWLAELNAFYEFGHAVYANCVDFLDRFLAATRIKPKYLRIVGITCFLIASKLTEEIDVQPTLKELVANCNSEFSASDITRMETIVLSKLGWKLLPVTPLTVLDELLSVAHERVVLRFGPEASAMFSSLHNNAAQNVNKCLFHYQLARLPAAHLAMCSLAQEIASVFDIDDMTELFEDVLQMMSLSECEFVEISRMVATHLCRHKSA